MGFDDIEYYRNHRDTDPTYTAYDALNQFLTYNNRFDEALDLANQIWNGDEEEYGPRLLTYGECWDVIYEMEPSDAFRAGAQSDELWKDMFYTYDGQRFRWIRDPMAYMRDVFHAAIGDIIDGKYRLSKDLRAVLDSVTKGEFRTCNAKRAGGSPARASKAKPVKTVPKASKNTRTKAKAPAKKTATRSAPRRYRYGILSRKRVSG